VQTSRCAENHAAEIEEEETERTEKSRKFSDLPVFSSSIQQSMNPFLPAFFVVGDVEVSQFSHEITVNCALLV
jgi:hypothetical protein